MTVPVRRVWSASILMTIGLTKNSVPGSYSTTVTISFMCGSFFETERAIVACSDVMSSRFVLDSINPEMCTPFLVIATEPVLNLVVSRLSQDNFDAAFAFLNISKLENVCLAAKSANIQTSLLPIIMQHFLQKIVEQMNLVALKLRIHLLSILAGETGRRTKRHGKRIVRQQIV